MFTWTMPSLSLRRHRQQRHQSLRPRRPGSVCRKSNKGSDSPLEVWIRPRMVGLGGLEPPTSPLSGARSSHLSYRPQHRRGNVHNYLIVRWFSVFRNCAESALRYKTATSPVHLLCTISESEFRLSRRVHSAQRQDVLAQPGSAVFSRRSDQQTEPQCGSSKINS